MDRWPFCDRIASASAAWSSTLSRVSASVSRADEGNRLPLGAGKRADDKIEIRRREPCSAIGLNHGIQYLSIRCARIGLPLVNRRETLARSRRRARRHAHPIRFPAIYLLESCHLRPAFSPDQMLPPLVIPARRHRAARRRPAARAVGPAVRVARRGGGVTRQAAVGGLVRLQPGLHAANGANNSPPNCAAGVWISPPRA